MSSSAEGLRCPQCGSSRLWKDGLRSTAAGEVQRYLCRECAYRFSEPGVCCSAVTPLPLYKAPETAPTYLDPNSRCMQEPVEGVPTGLSNLIDREGEVSLRGVGPNTFGFQAVVQPPIAPLNKGGSSHREQPSSGQTQPSELVATILSKELKTNPGITNVYQISAQEAKNLDAAQNQQQAAGISPQTAQSKGLIVEHAFWMQKEGYAESTITRRIRLLGTLVNKGANLQDPESVKEAIASQKNWTAKTKEIAVETYACMLKMRGLTWNAPKYQACRKLPFIPTEEEINSLIAGCNRKTAAFLQLLKETGMRCGEAFLLEWADLDFENRTVNITPEKGSEPRQLRISSQLIAMLNSLVKDKAKPFQCSPRHFTRTFRMQRARIAHKLKNPRILKIHFHTLRHWKATMEYAKTKDILHVKQMLGHKSIQNTLLYTQLISFEKDEFHSATAKTVQEAQQLVEAGFEYVCDFGDTKLFRKRK